MVSFKLEQGTKITNEEKKMLEEAKKLPLVYDEDSPELTVEMEKAFIEAGRNKPYNAEPLTVYVSCMPYTIKKSRFSQE